MKIIRNSFIPFKGYKAMNLFGFLFCREDARIDDITINHESIHTAQMKEMLYVPFYIWYFIEWLIRLCMYFDSHKAYRKIRFEQEAYMHEKDMSYLDSRRNFAWID